MARKNAVEQNFFWMTRLLTLTAVLSSIAGAVLMFFLGATKTLRAFAVQLGTEELAEGVPADVGAVIWLMDALDHFLIALVLLFFGYGVYGLFIRPDYRAVEIGLPSWIHVERIGQLKQTLAEVIIVVLFVLFLREALQTFHSGVVVMTPMGMGRFLLLPISILVLSAALRLVQLHPKGRDLPPPESARERALTPTMEDGASFGERKTPEIKPSVE